MHLLNSTSVGMFHTPITDLVTHITSASSSCHRGHAKELACFWSLCLIFSSVCPVTLPPSMSLCVLVLAVDDHYPQLYITVRISLFYDAGVLYVLVSSV